MMSEPLELKLQVVSCMIWMLITKFRSSGRAARALTC